METHERRRHFRGKPRAGRRIELSFRPLDDTESAPVVAFTRNIGVGGAYILTGTPEPVGTTLHLELQLPDGPTDTNQADQAASTTPLVLECDVRWVAPAEDERDLSGMGVRFAALDVDAVLRLNDYFASLTTRSESAPIIEGEPAKSS